MRTEPTLAQAGPDHAGEVVVVTGMTGAGRSTAAKELEDPRERSEQMTPLSRARQDRTAASLRGTR